MTAAAVACVVLGAVAFGISLATGEIAWLYVSSAAAVAAMLVLAGAVIQHRRRTELPRDGR